jgi:hypothetical protein
VSNNLLQSIDFQFSIKRLKETNYFIQRASIPGIQLGDSEQPNRFGGRIYYPGQKLNHDELSITFKVDEDMANWLEVYGWLIGLSAPQQAEQFTKLATSGDGWVSDATLIVMSSQKNPLHQFTFRNLFPKTLSEIELDVTQTDITFVTATATFQYDYMDYQNIKKV